MPIRCEIVTQERMVFSEDVDSVNLPGIEGRMGILPHHSPLLTVLDFGEVIIKQAGREEYFAIGGGFAEVQPDKVIILADSAEHAEEIDEAKAEEARQKAIAAEQNSVGNVIISSTVGAASSALGNRMTIDAAARAASMRTRF